jgi:predicted DNA-binding transcriptional regulator AlpA
LPDTAIQRGFTIRQFCERWGFSRPHFYQLRKTGDAPDVLGTGKGQRISDAAEARWLKRQEAKAAKRRKSGAVS